MIEPCRACGASNRVPAERLDQRARCGTCMRPILPLARPHALHSTAEFDELVNASPLTVLVDFWAPWCQPCRAVECEVERVAREKAGGAIIAKVNTDEMPEIAQRFKIRAVPTFIVFQAGRETKRIEGAHVASDLLHAMTP